MSVAFNPFNGALNLIPSATSFSSAASPIVVRDEFIGGGSTIGDLGWSQYTPVGSSAALTRTPSSTTQPFNSFLYGIADLQVTSSTGGNYTVLYTTTTNNGTLNFNNAGWDASFVFWLPAPSSMTCAVGFAASLSQFGYPSTAQGGWTLPNNSILFVRDSTKANNNYLLAGQANNTKFSGDLGVLVGTGGTPSLGYQGGLFRMRCVTSGTVLASWNNGAEISVTIPQDTGGFSTNTGNLMQPVVMVGINGTQAAPAVASPRNIVIDYFGLSWNNRKIAV